ncbi:MAG: hypothetical protein WBB05_12910 [Mycolicibacterium fortuitum]
MASWEGGTREFLGNRVYTAAPGSESCEKLQLLSVIGALSM